MQKNHTETLVAHRGDHEFYPENSLGANLIETDNFSRMYLELKHGR